MAKTALCIGINDYPGTGSDLEGCVNDVMDWKAVLEDRKFTVRTLVDGEATKAAMVKSIRKLITGARAGDTVVLQYSGHGSWVPDDNGDEDDARDEVLCPHDIASGRFLRDDELYDLLAERKPDVRVIYLADCCHSGTVTRLAPLGREAPKYLPRSRYLPPGVFLSRSRIQIARRVARAAVAGPKPHQGLLISGCQDHQTSADAWFNGRPNGAFSYFAIRALAAVGGSATYSKWYKGIRKFLPSTAYDQIPNLYGTATQQNWKVFG